MKKTNFYVAALLATMTTATSCSEDTDNNGSSNGLSQEQKSIVANYADKVVVARYSKLANDGKALLVAVKAIQSSTATDKTSLIKTAADAWKSARISWERTEAYLFGPVDKAGIDPGIDSWPLDLPELQKSIQKWDPTKDSYKTLATDGGDLKGFHAIEYMLFKNGSAKTNSVAAFDSEYSIDKGSLTDAQFQAKLESYTVAVAEELYRCVLQLEAEWNKAGLSADKKADFTAFGKNITMNTPSGDYADIFKNPSLDNAYYNSFSQAVSEAFTGAVGIADEVANVKISDPINAQVEDGTGLLEVESWFSYNSIADFTNNVRGIKEAYFGELCTNEAQFDADTTPAANSLGALVAKADKAAGDKAVKALNDAIAKVSAMDGPFRDNLSWSAKNTAAKEAVAAVQAALEEAVTVIPDAEIIPEEE